MQMHAEILSVWQNFIMHLRILCIGSYTLVLFNFGIFRLLVRIIFKGVNEIWNIDSLQWQKMQGVWTITLTPTQVVLVLISSPELR